MAPTTLINKAIFTNALSPSIALSDFLIMESTQTNQDTTAPPAVSWATLAHRQITMEPTIADLTRKYNNTCKHTGNPAYYCWKLGLPFLPPQTRQTIHQYNLKYRSTHKLPLNDQPFCPPPHFPFVKNINTHSQPDNLLLFQQPVHTLTPLAVHHKSHPLLLNKKIYRNSSLNLKN